MKGFYKSGKRFVLFWNDCFELLQYNPVEKVQFIFVDPPYMVSRGGVTCKSGKLCLVDKGDWDRPVEVDKYVAKIRKLLKLCNYILGESGSVAICGTLHNIHLVGYAVQQLGWKIINDIIWEKPNPPPNLLRKCFTHSHEQIIWCTPRKKYKFNYDTMKRITGKQCKTVWKGITPPTKREKIFGSHPTQKPIRLLHRLIFATTDIGDLVLDPMCGSGTAGVVSLMNGRKFIGVDTNRSNLDLSMKRFGLYATG